jgi:hypothetical protein
MGGTNTCCCDDAGSPVESPGLHVKVSNEEVLSLKTRRKNNSAICP